MIAIYAYYTILMIYVALAVGCIVWTAFGIKKILQEPTLREQHRKLFLSDD